MYQINLYLNIDLILLSIYSYTHTPTHPYTHTPIHPYTHTPTHPSLHPPPAAILVFDCTDRASFGRVQGWVRELRRATSDDIIIVIAENKIDLERQRVVSHDEAVEYALDMGRGGGLMNGWIDEWINE